MSFHQIKQATCSPSVHAEAFRQYSKHTCDKYQLNTTARPLCFLAQVEHESGGLFFTQQLAGGAVYQSRKKYSSLTIL
jgi:putative chitinase